MTTRATVARSGAFTTLSIGLFFLAGLVSPSMAQWDAARDFYSPRVFHVTSSAWSYGWEATLGSEFIPFADGRYDGLGQSYYYGLDNWSKDPGAPFGFFYPMVVHNTFDSPESALWSIKPLPEGGLGFHPGPLGEYAVIRWEAPWTGSYDLSATFDALKMASTDIHVLLNNEDMFSGLLMGRFGIESVARYDSILSLQAGDTLDFAVGYGPNRNFNSDSTGLSARIQAVPEPGVLSLLGSGLLGLGGLYAARRRRT
jgi:hypothetical protein